MPESDLSLTLWDIRRDVMRTLGIGNVYQTGTVTSTGTTAMTLTGGTWPEWTENSFLVNKASGERVRVVTRSSDTVLVMASSTTWTAVAFELSPWGQVEEDMLYDALTEGYRRYLIPPPTPNRKTTREWSFLSPQASIVTVAPYTTGTVTIALGVVTLTGGTFPTWAADGELSVGSGDYAGRRFSVNTRDGSAQITLDDTTISQATAVTFVLAKLAYDFPDDYVGMTSQGFTFRPGASTWNNAVIRQAGMQQIDIANEKITSSNTPIMFGIRVKTFSGTTRYSAVFHPAPNAAYTLDYYYRVMPNMMTAANPRPYGGLSHSNLLLSSCLAVAEEKMNDTSGLHQAKFQQLLMAAIDLDERANTPQSFGVDPQRFTNRTYYGSTPTSLPYQATYHNGFFRS
jgi:hypothetical protein